MLFLTLGCSIILVVLSALLYENAYSMKVTSLVRNIPTWARYPLTLLAFYPTIIYARLYAALYPTKRRLWDVVYPKILCGVAPVLSQDVETLYTREGVRAVVNLCREWDQNRGLYERMGISQCYAPTTDFECPTLAETMKCVYFMREHLQAGRSVYVHCKAGRGRSVCVVLAYLVTYEGLSPAEADAIIRAKRPHISKKWHLPLLTSVAEKARGERGEGQGSRASSSSSSPTNIGSAGPTPSAPLFSQSGAAASSSASDTMALRSPQ
jgi:atypical dual specificity phosphatase